MLFLMATKTTGTVSNLFYSESEFISYFSSMFKQYKQKGGLSIGSKNNQ